MRRRAENHPSFDFEKKTDEELTKEAFEKQRAKIKEGRFQDQAYKETFDKVYPLLNAEEAKELRNLKTPKERLAYIIKKYGTLFRKY
jgi:hypothetical protein